MHRRRTTRAVGTAVAVLGVFLSTLSPASAAARPVVDTDFPTIDEVAAIYPFYAGGWRQFVDDPELILITRNCLDNRAGPTAPYGGRGLYWGTDANPSPLDDGDPEPTVEVYRFNSRARAHRVLDRVRDNAVRCYGRSAAGQLVRRRHPITVPDLGSEPPLAWRTRLRNRPDREEVPDYRGIDIWMRRGRFLILVNVFQITAPTKAPVVTLAQRALDAIG